MVIWIRTIGLAAIVGIFSNPAHAADWWWVSGEPEDNAVFFADADSIDRHGTNVTLSMQRIEKSGEVIETVQHLRCDVRLSTRDEEALRRFACSTEEERIHFALMLGEMTPRQTAGLIFAMKAADPPS